MYTKFISKIIQEKLKAKERALSRSSKPIQDQEPDGSLDLKKLASRTTFARMCSNKAEVPNILIAGGENDENGMAMGFGKTYRDRTKNTDDGTEYGYRTIGPLVKKPVDNSGIRAIPGIKVNTLLLFFRSVSCGGLGLGKR